MQKIPDFLREQLDCRIHEWKPLDEPYVKASVKPLTMPFLWHSLFATNVIYPLDEFIAAYAAVSPSSARVIPNKCYQAHTAFLRELDCACKLQDLGFEVYYSESLDCKHGCDLLAISDEDILLLGITTKIHSSSYKPVHGFVRWVKPEGGAGLHLVSEGALKGLMSSYQASQDQSLALESLR